MSAKHKVSALANRHNRMKMAVGAILATFAIAGSAALATSNAFALPTAAALECPAGTTDLGVTGKIVCEVTYTSANGATFKFPNYVHSAEALIVGAGGASNGGYAGGGGDVKIVGLDTATDATITVGTSNSGFGTSNVTQGTTSHNADAGVDGYDGTGVSPDPVAGQSGAGLAGSFFQTGVGAGGGAGTAAGLGAANDADPLALYGGEGLQPADIAGTGSLFANETACYGGGGSTWSSSYLTYVSGAKTFYSTGLAQGGEPTNVYCAGGYATNALYQQDANLTGAVLSNSRNTVTQNGVSYVYHGSNSVPDYIANGVSESTPHANSGDGAGAYFSQTSTFPGADGYVAIRFQLLRTIYVVPNGKTKKYGDAAPTYDYQLCTDAACTGGPVSGPAGMTDPTCTSDYVPLSNTTGDVASSPRTITCSGGEKLGYDFITTPTADLTIEKADAVCSVTPYDVTYDGYAHTDNGSCTGVDNENLSSDLTVASSNTDAGEYKGEAWSFTDSTGNYNNDSGSVDNYIRQADAICNVDAYDVDYDATSHTDSGSCYGVNEEDLSSGLSYAPGNTDAGTYSDEGWTFTAPNNNYKNTSGSVTNYIRAIDATCAVGEYHVTYDGESHVDTGECHGIDNVDLSSGLTVAPGNTNAGDYPSEPWSFTDVNGNYKDQSGTSNNSIDKADATCSVDAYDVVYDGNSHQDTGSCTGVKGENLNSDLTVAGPNTSAGDYYAEPWSFNDSTGNYKNQSGSVDNFITKANAVCNVTGYNVQYDGNSHVDSGTCTGANSEDLSGGLTVSPAHTAVGDYMAEGWSFTDVSGNYNDDSGSVDNHITPIPTNVNYTGGPNTLNPGGVITPSYDGVPPLCTATVVYELNLNPLTGAAGPYTLTGPTIDTTGWLPGNYVITVSYPSNDANCTGSSNTSPVTINNPVVPPVVNPCGTEAEIEHYAQTHEDDGCEVEHHDNGDNSGSETRHEGDVRWEFKDCWKFSGTSTGFAKTDSRNARVTAVGTLSYWNKTTKAWVVASSTPVEFTANFLSANSNAKSPVTLSSFFGVKVTGTKKAGAPALPSFATTNALHGTFKFN